MNTNSFQIFIILMVRSDMSEGSSITWYNHFMKNLIILIYLSNQSMKLQSNFLASSTLATQIAQKFHNENFDF
jgi:hypothetical protein